MFNIEILKKKRELLQLKKIACLYLNEYKKEYYENVANVSELIELEKTVFEPIDGKNQYIKTYKNLIMYENGYHVFQAGKQKVNYKVISPYQKKR